jgi:VIT1/CCC1 family predicted Fe2+/Mn2+ transporter
MSDKSLVRNLQAEIDASHLYRLLGELEQNPDIRSVFFSLSTVEGKHAEAFKEKMRNDGRDIILKPSCRARILGWMARRFGPQLVIPLLIDLEKGISNALIRKKMEQGKVVTGREFVHCRILESIGNQTGAGVEGGRVAQLEGRHRGLIGNALRAAVLGANDGLLSNFSLVMGVAGAAVSSQTILITGFAGLLAGSTSMALGEWLSVQSSRELYSRQIEIEAEELESSPEEEMHELALIYQAKGISDEEALKMSRKIVENKETALETLAREELGVDPDELGGSAWTAAITSFILFAAGAILPVVPFIFFTGHSAIVLSVLVSCTGLFGIGAAITLLTGRNAWFSGFRQLMFGLMAAAITYGIGYLLGVSLSG